MKSIQRLLAIAFAATGAAVAADSTQITDEASAIAAAKRYMKARCTGETPCAFRPKREGPQWNVWVEFTKRGRAGEKPQPYHGGHAILYFNQQGQLVRRIDGE
jgi:hypothetical protein